MAARLISLVLSFYFILDLVASKVVHCTTLASCAASPTFLQTAVYCAIFGCIGIPLVTGTVMWQSRWHADL